MGSVIVKNVKGELTSTHTYTTNRLSGEFFVEFINSCRGPLDEDEWADVEANNNTYQDEYGTIQHIIERSEDEIQKNRI